MFSSTEASPLSFDLSVLNPYWHLLGTGVLWMLFYTLVTSAAGLVIGTFIGLMQTLPIRPLAWVGRIFVELFRNIPLLVILLWIYYALPIFTQLTISKEVAGILALSLYVAAFYAEIVRAGVLSVERGQGEAAMALGMSYPQRMRRVILPQALRRMIPPLAGQTIVQMKNTTLLSVITVPELLYQAGYVSSLTYRPMEVYTTVGLLFLLILTPLTWLARRVELRQGRE